MERGSFISLVRTKASAFPFAILRSGGGLRDRVALSKAQNRVKLNPSRGLSGESRYIETEHDPGEEAVGKAKRDRFSTARLSLIQS